MSTVVLSVEDGEYKNICGKSFLPDKEIGEISKVVDWLRNLPGVDEATALSSALERIYSGDYDVIVFDTAPTGHTLKMLAMPPLLQAGLEKLEGVSGWMYSMMDTFGSMFSAEGTSISAIKAKIEQKLTQYVGKMTELTKLLQDSSKTT